MPSTSRIVSELMRQPLISVGPGASVQEVLELATTKGIHHIPFVRQGRLLGLVCTCDLKAARPDLRALQLARRHVVTVTPDCSVADAARLMISNVVGSLVIANGDGLWGIVTRDDLSRASAELASLLSEGRCAACQSSHHLQRGPGDTLLCASCTETANARHWFDEGGSN